MTMVPVLKMVVMVVVVMVHVRVLADAICLLMLMWMVKNMLGLWWSCFCFCCDGDANYWWWRWRWWCWWWAWWRWWRWYGDDEDEEYVDVYVDDYVDVDHDGELSKKMNTKALEFLQECKKRQLRATWASLHLKEVGLAVGFLAYSFWSRAILWQLLAKWGGKKTSLSSPLKENVSDGTASCLFWVHFHSWSRYVTVCHFLAGCILSQDVDLTRPWNEANTIPVSEWLECEPSEGAADRSKGDGKYRGAFAGPESIPYSVRSADCAGGLSLSQDFSVMFSEIDLPNSQSRIFVQGQSGLVSSINSKLAMSFSRCSWAAAGLFVPIPAAAPYQPIAMHFSLRWAWLQRCFSPYLRPDSFQLLHDVLQPHPLGGPILIAASWWQPGRVFLQA